MPGRGVEPGIEECEGKVCRETEMGEDRCLLVNVNKGQFQIVVSLATCEPNQVPPVGGDRLVLHRARSLSKDVTSWSSQGCQNSVELLGRKQARAQSIASSAFLKAINSHLSCNIDLLCEIAVSVNFFKAIQLGPFPESQDVQGLVCSIFLRKAKLCCSLPIPTFFILRGSHPAVAGGSRPGVLVFSSLSGLLIGGFTPVKGQTAVWTCDRHPH